LSGGENVENKNRNLVLAHLKDERFKSTWKSLYSIAKFTNMTNDDAQKELNQLVAYGLVEEMSDLVCKSYRLVVF
jgi:RIO-like serine/threonine protein kinase